VPALAEALDAPTEETRIAAVRGLGRTGLVQAAIPLLDHLVAGELRVPEHAVKNALASCCQGSPSILIKYLNRSNGRSRELLARVLGELATPELGEDLILLASDPLPEVRASAARALSRGDISLSLPTLSVLATDPEWFVRLRAVVALGGLEHSGRIRPLLRALCDLNRYVRQRAAWALARIEPELNGILAQVVETQDDYALQAFVSELERCGTIDKVVHALERGENHDSAHDALLQALSAGRKRVEMAAKAMSASAGGR
jgi:HEAT repeat protein